MTTESEGSQSPPSGTPSGTPSSSAPKTLGQRIAQAQDDKALAKSKDRGRGAEMLEEKAEQTAEAAVGFLAENAKVIGIATMGALVAIGGFFTWRELSDSKSGEVLQALTESVGVATATIRAEGTSTADVKGISFSSRKERAKEAAELYAGFVKQHDKLPAAVWARLGQGTSLLDQGKPKEARKAFESANTKDADVDVKIRALEGIGFTYESEKNWAQAEKTYEGLRELRESAPAIEDLGDYHIARMKARMGKEKDAIKVLVALLERLDDAKRDAPPMRYVRNQAELQTLRLDPMSAPSNPAPVNSGASGLSQEQIQRLLDQLKQQEQSSKTIPAPAPGTPAPAAPESSTPQ